MPLDIPKRKQMSVKAARLIQTDLLAFQTVLLSPKEPLSIKERELIETRIKGLEERLILSFETIFETILDPPPEQ